MADTPLDAEIQRIRSSGILGQSGPLPALFDFLAVRTAQGAPPKEIEIAVSVFGKDGGASAGDASVRVYVHRLRKKLEDFYLRDGNNAAPRLAIPRGEYRFTLAAPTDVQIEPESDEPEPARLKLNPAIVFVAIVLILNAAAWMWFAARDGRNAGGDDGFWADINRGTTPLMIVVGDYYVIGETDDAGNLRRLVREFGINSKEDLYTYLMDHPDQVQRYSDQGLSYLPTSVARALFQVAAGITPGRRVQIMLASEFPLEALRRNDVIYIGLFSGLGRLRDTVLATSRFTVGASYDEIIDTLDGTRYHSQAAGSATKGTMYRDFGYVSAFAGPNNNRIAVIAGTRDAALMGAADAVSQRGFMSEIAAPLKNADSFEALYEVQGAGRVNLQSRLLAVAALDPKKIWSAVANSRLFPAE